MITLPFPPSRISPNAKGQGKWRGKADAAATYRDACLWSLKAQRPTIAADDTHLTITFCPPCNRRRDLDNLLAMTKQGIDALAEYAKIDDSAFTYTLLRGEKVKGGIVQIVAGQYLAGGA